MLSIKILSIFTEVDNPHRFHFYLYNLEQKMPREENHMEIKWQTSNEELVRIKAARYFDDKWDQITNNNNASLEARLEKERKSTVEESREKFFSKPRDRYCKKI
ncbi:hypothetical protein RclHR1_01460019 [Rhizophagus clarus]|uniref:Uncharacterized protein n=1 Tax=Rhizophagus clarus TaxID=94130 RepID=A0A2Z6QQF8_9GLOM|nr:hypothetical protein RclHR1_01460019 [Rhizophagus clarus]